MSEDENSQTFILEIDGVQLARIMRAATERLEKKRNGCRFAEKHECYAFQHGITVDDAWTQGLVCACQCHVLEWSEEH